MGLAKGLLIVAAIPGFFVLLYFILIITLYPDDYPRKSMSAQPYG